MTAQVGSLTATLADFAVRTRTSEVPGDVSRVARQCLLDWIGCTLAGSSDPIADILIAEIEAQGGYPISTIIGRGRKAAPAQAALVNGTVSHVLDFDDVHHALNGHPSAPVIPAVLAVAEQVDAGGEDVIAAIAVAMEVECRIGAMLGPSHHRRGFNPAGTAGTFGAAVGAGRLLGLSAVEMATALGLAGAQAASMQSMVRTMAMPLHSGKAAANGILAASLARRGMSASLSCLEGPQSYPAMTSDRPDATAALDRLGDRWIMLDTVFKYHVACYGAHPAIEATRAIVDKHGVRGDQVAKASVRVSSFIQRLCNISEPADPIGMKFSLPQNVAMVLNGLDTGAIATYSPQTLADAELSALRRAIVVQGDDTFADWRTCVDVNLHDGRQFACDIRLDQPCRDLKSAAGEIGIEVPCADGSHRWRHRGEPHHRGRERRDASTKCRPANCNDGGRTRA